MTTFPYKEGKPLVWNFTVVDTVCSTYCHTAAEESCKMLIARDTKNTKIESEKLANISLPIWKRNWHKWNVKSCLRKNLDRNTTNRLHQRNLHRRFRCKTKRRLLHCGPQGQGLGSWPLCVKTGGKQRSTCTLKTYCIFWETSRVGSATVSNPKLKETYRQQIHRLFLENHLFSHEFLIAVTCLPILGNDFLQKYNIKLTHHKIWWNKRRTVLVELLFLPFTHRPTNDMETVLIQDKTLKRAGSRGNYEASTDTQ